MTDLAFVHVFSSTLDILPEKHTLLDYLLFLACGQQKEDYVKDHSWIEADWLTRNIT